MVVLSKLTDGTKPEIKHVIHSNNVCTILWKDGVKTQSICHKEDMYNKDVGFLVAYLKRFMSTSEIVDLMEKWSYSQPKQEEVQAVKKEKKLIKQSQKYDTDIKNEHFIFNGQVTYKPFFAYYPIFTEKYIYQ